MKNAVCLAIIALFAGSLRGQEPAPEAPKQEKVKLAAACAKGTTCQVKTDLLVDMDIATVDFRGAKLTTSTKLVLNEAFTVEIAEVGDAGPTLLNVQCASSTVTKDLSQPAKTSIDGKRLTLRKTEKGLKTDTEGLDIKSRDLGFVENIDFHRQFLPPGGEAALKQMWKFKPAGLLDILCGGIKGDFRDEMTCTLTKVENNIAEIALSYEAASAHTPTASSKSTLEGILLFDTAAGRPLSIKLAGKLSTNSEITWKEEGTNRLSNVGAMTVDVKKIELSIEYSPVPR